MDRRRFLSKSGAAILSAYYLSACRSARTNPASAGPGRAFVFLESKDGTSTARILDLQTMRFKDVEVPLVNPHSAQRVLTGDSEFIAFDFMGRAVKANVKTGHILPAPTGSAIFMGHGTQTNNGEIIWCTEVEKKNEILVRARRTTDLSLIDSPLHRFPGGHHVSRLPGSEILATGWYDLEAKLPGVRFFDCRSGEGKIVRLPPSITVSHLLPVSPTEIVAITHVLSTRKQAEDPLNKRPIIQTAYDSMLKTNSTANKSPGHLDFDPASPAPLVYANTKGETETFWIEENAELFRYGFSIDGIDLSPKKFISTHTLGNTVIIWNLDKTVNHYISVPSPMGAISVSGGEKLLILSQGKLKVWAISERDFVDEITYERPITSVSRYS